MEKFQAVEALTRYQLEEEAATAALAAGVHQARDLGASWSEIGAMLGTTRQAAQQKYGKPATTAGRPDPDAVNIWLSAPTLTRIDPTLADDLAAEAEAQAEEKPAEATGAQAAEVHTATPSKATRAFQARAAKLGLKFTVEDTSTTHIEQLMIVVDDTRPGGGYALWLQTAIPGKRPTHTFRVVYTAGGKSHSAKQRYASITLEQFAGA